ncbi:DUF2809 domain-containing protein [Kriegella sp. EG-1]|nr:DUF2809 domain-containing protein [Flavobacteriaceae bacterium EG-1]
MKTIFNKSYFILFLILLLAEILIAALLKDGFIRHTVGDFLVVLLLYCLFKSFLQVKPLPIALVTLVIAYLVEFMQLTDFLNNIGLERNKWANLIFGNTFNIQDLVAYTLGFVFVIFSEKLQTKIKSFKNLSA